MTFRRRRRLSKSNSKSGKDYEVGYGKPPKETQFKPGQSGNPRGRPKGTNNLKTDLMEELGERVRVTENGRQLTLSKQRLLVKALVAKAIKGDARASDILIKLVAQTVGLMPDEEQMKPLTEDDNRILEAFLARAISTDDHGGSV